MGGDVQDVYLKWLIILSFILAVIGGIMVGQAWSREGDDHGNHGELKAWFDALRSQNGLCCSFADGIKVEDVDWDTGGPNASYRVRLADHWVADPAFNENQILHWIPAPGTSFSWVPIPAGALIQEPNKFGAAVVWPIIYRGELTRIRCFMPGAGT